MQEFLAKHHLAPEVELNAKKSALGEDEAFNLLEEIDELYAAKGKSVTHLNLKHDKPDREALKRLVLGPTGNLRAPTLRRGRTLVVGFDESTYKRVFSS